MLGRTRPLALAVLLVGVVAACGSSPSDSKTPPRLHACRELTAKDLTKHSNDTDPVSCGSKHTAQTFFVGTIPRTTSSSYDDPRNGRFVYDRCTPAFGRYIGADESRVMRIQLSWSWFRPSEKAWDAGARWFRCDVVGGPEGAPDLRPLPRSVAGMFQGRPSDSWQTCARGTQFAHSVKVSCAQPHDWRAVTTIKLGQPGDPYPGDRVSEVRSRDYCSDSVGAWLNYLPDYEYAYTWFHEAEWKAGNRRSICWAKTDR